MSLSAQAVTYTSASEPFNWIDASTHTQVGHNTTPYKFSNTGSCGSNAPVIDDSLSDNIPIGFTFNYGGTDFTQVRIMTNGRLQFNNNTTCGFGSPVTQLPYPNTGLNYSMRIYGNDLDPTAKSDVPSYNTTCVNRTSCYISYATLGVAPNRRFVVTWFHVPEWTATSTASGSYDLQIILEEGGDFVYQFGNDIPGPGNVNAQVGWQVDSADYDVPQVGFPAINSAIRFSIPRPVAEYRMEQSAWSGAANEVLDTSGNNRHGVRVGSAQTIAGGYICRGGNIPGNSNLGSLDAVNTGLNIPAVTGGAGTISFWYKPANWAGNGNQDAQLLDASAASPNWFFLTKRRISNSTVRLRFVIRDSAGNDRVAETGNLDNTVLSASGWVHIAVSWNFNALAASNSDHLRIYVNGAQSVQSAFTTSGGLAAGIGTLYLGDNGSGNVGVSGTARSADGVLDDVRVYNFEGGIGLVQRDKNITGGCPALDHVRIEHDGSGQTCAVEMLTVKACATAACTTYYTDGAVTGNVIWAGTPGGSIPFTIPANTGGQTKVNLAVGSAQTVTLAASGVAPAPSVGSQCLNLSSNTLSCSLPFSASSSCFDAVEVGQAVATPIYTKLSATAFSLDVRAISSGTVPAGYTGTVEVSLVNPTAGSGNCTDTNVGLNAVATYTFTEADNNRRTFNFNYPNAAKNVKVRIRDTAVTTPSCSTDNFAIRPVGLTVSASANADASGVSVTAMPVVKAGAAFTLNAAAGVSGYDGTPVINTGLMDAHAGALATGVLAGAFGAADPSTGVASGNTFSYGEAGYFRLRANSVTDGGFTSVDQPNDCTNDVSNTLVGGKYGCKFTNAGATAFFGRFIPDRFSTVVTQGCAAGGYTYSGQPFSVVVTALNVAGNPTANYDGAAAPVLAKGVVLSDANALGAGSFGGSDAVAAAAFASGVAIVAPTYTFTNQKTVPGMIRLRATESAGADGVTSSGGIEGLATLRSGRLSLRSNAGSELMRLALPLETQYWQEGGNAAITTDDYWTTNVSDSCTAIPVAALTLNNYRGSLAAGETLPAIGGNFVQGRGSLSMSAPGPGNNGSVDVTVGNLAAGVPWLGTNPTARATFGLRKTPLIYLRENY